MKTISKANELLRSALAIAKRKGKDTNWEPFENQLSKELNWQSAIQHGIGNPVYKIKPLEWTGKIIKLYDSIWANTPFGSYFVNKDGSGFNWGYYFKDHHEEEEFRCDSITDGKKQAEENWRGRLSGVLIPWRTR